MKRSLTLAKKFVWLLREDVRSGKSPSDLPDKNFATWWLVRGRSEYPAWSKLSQIERQLLQQLVGTHLIAGVKVPLSQAMQWVLQYRPDVLQNFTKDGKSDLTRLVAWFYILGIREHALEDMIDDRWRDVLATSISCQQIAMEAGISSSNDSQLTVDDSKTAKGELALPLIMALTYLLMDNKFHQSVPIHKIDGRARFIQWFTSEAIQKFSLMHLLSDKLKAALNISKKEITKDEKAKQLINQADNAVRAIVNWQDKPFGVNLFGFAKGELGIGEDVRMAALCCEESGIPYQIINIPLDSNVREGDGFLAEQIKQSNGTAPYAFNIFCMPAFDMASRYYLKRGGIELEGHFNIGWWPWELSVWPKAWAPAFEMVDEVWASSNFTLGAYQKATTKRTQLMPLAVSVDRVMDLTRKEFGLPEDKFLFLFVFDFNSHLERKNPDAIIEAFQLAFKKKDNDNVGLVFKVMNTNSNDEKWKKFIARCSLDKRILIFDTTFSRNKVLGLIKACDCYVSLHRSEGFGRTIAEAMILNRQIIATNYSGNKDYLNSKDSFLVDTNLTEVKKGYQFLESSDCALWANPKISIAASFMQDAIKNKKDPYIVQNRSCELISSKYIGGLMHSHFYNNFINKY
jgi:glycosyltransferase involved in cell wall biosynthesis